MDYVAGILNGDRAILSKAITLVESSREVDRRLADDIVDSCLRVSRDSIVVGVTGIPGAGKSSLIEALGKHIITNQRAKVAVLAVDPSSRISGGSILGDKTRMSFLASSAMAYIRPSPTRGMLGGVAHRTREAIVLCKAAGYRYVFVETVGVGQSETTVRDMVDFFLMVALAGAGDELQGIKRGVMEMADAVVVNKADGDNLCEAEKARAEAERALHFLRPSLSGWVPRAMICSARTGLGVEEIWLSILAHHDVLRESGKLEQSWRDQQLHWLHESVEEGLMQLFLADPVVKERWTDIEQKVAAGQITALSAARSLLSFYESERRALRVESGPDS